MSEAGRVLDVIAFVAIRKSVMYEYLVKRAMEKNIDVNSKELKNRIASADNLLFISEFEKKKKRLSVTTALESTSAFSMLVKDYGL